MGAEHAVCAVGTQGNPGRREWTTRYKLAVSRDGVTWSFHQENNIHKVTGYVVSRSRRGDTENNRKFEHQTFSISLGMTPAHLEVLSVKLWCGLGRHKL